MSLKVYKSGDNVAADGEPPSGGSADGYLLDMSALHDEAADRIQRVVQLQDEARWQYQLANHSIEQIRHSVEHGSASPFDIEAQAPQEPDETPAAPGTVVSRSPSKLPALLVATLGVALLAITTGLIVSLQAATTDPVSPAAMSTRGDPAVPAESPPGTSPMTTVATVTGAVTAAATTPSVPAVDLDFGSSIYAPRFAKAPASERACLARAVYYESRGEAIEGQIAVAQVILNRARSKKWPGTICGVVNQGVERGEKCQFSFACFQHMSEPTGEMWDQALLLSDQALAGQSWLRELVDATHYHTTGVAPVWRLGLTEIATIGTHVFYREGGGVRARVVTAQAYQASSAVQAVRAKVAAVKAAQPKLAATAALPAVAAPKKAPANSNASDWKTSVFQQ